MITLEGQVDYTYLKVLARTDKANLYQVRLDLAIWIPVAYLDYEDFNCFCLIQPFSLKKEYQVKL